jgi:hypothetical protein
LVSLSTVIAVEAAGGERMREIMDAILRYIAMFTAPMVIVGVALRLLRPRK